MNQKDRVGERAYDISRAECFRTIMKIDLLFVMLDPDERGPLVALFFTVEYWLLLNIRGCPPHYRCSTKLR